MRLDRLNDGGHRGDAFQRRLEHVGPVVFVAEHYGVDTACLQSFDIREHALDELQDAAVRVIER